MSFIFKSEDIVTDIFPWEHIPFILQILTWRSSAPDTMRGMLGWKAAQFTPRSWPWDQSKRTQISFKPTTNFIHSTPTALYNTKIGSSFFFMALQPHSYLKNMLHYCIRGPKQVDTRDATHLRVHSTRRQVLLPQTWKQHLQSDTHRGPFTNYTGTPTYRGGKREEQH